MLTPAEQALFQSYSYSDKWHTYRVLRTLKEAGCTQPELLTAALLHDVGKAGTQLSAWDRSLVVLMTKVAPRRADAWGQGEASGWRRPFVVKGQHAAWGAELARAAGSRPLVVELIRRHQEPLPPAAEGEVERLLCLLQWADDQN